MKWKSIKLFLEVFKIKISFVILDTARVERCNDMLHVTKASRRENLTILMQAGHFNWILLEWFIYFGFDFI